jgi:hypothetical protein
MNMNIQTRLRCEGAVEFEGMWLRYEGEWQDLQTGDTYAAERNQGPRLLTVRRVAETLGDGHFAGAVFAVENAYPYDLGECVKVSIHEHDPR